MVKIKKFGGFTAIPLKIACLNIGLTGEIHVITLIFSQLTTHHNSQLTTHHSQLIIMYINQFTEACSSVIIFLLL